MSRTDDRGKLRISAYVLLADPSYLRESILAYYPHVDRIVLSYDRTARSWTGTPLPIAQCLRMVQELDTDGKCIHAPGMFARLDHKPLSNETHQRQVALDIASDGADWVLQLDTDEVMLNGPTFFACLTRAHDLRLGGLDYPARWLYARPKPGHYLEKSTRRWSDRASYPGPLAVRAGTRLRLARQADVDLYRVDFRRKNTDPWHPASAPVHEVISRNDAVAHFSWVRDPGLMRRKFSWSGHTEQMRPPAVYRQWEWCMRHPYLAAATTPIRRRNEGKLRLTRIPEPPGGPPPPVEFEPQEITSSDSE